MVSTDTLTPAQREQLERSRARRAETAARTRAALAAIADEPEREMGPVIATVQLLHRFYDDHVARDLPAGRVTKRTKTLVHVELDRESYDELLSDALHYVDMGLAGAYRGEGGLLRSAATTVARLKRAVQE